MRHPISDVATAMMRHVLVLSFLGFLGCDQGKSAQATDSKPASTAKKNEGKAAEGKAAEGKAAEGKAAEGKAAQGAATNTACKDFVFELGNAVDETKSKPNRDDPVGRSSEQRLLSLHFTCGDDERVEEIDDLAFDCHGASCGCTYALDRSGGIDPEDPDECALEGDGGDDFEVLRAKDGPDVLASWAVLTAVERAHVAQIQHYRVKAVDGGFDVVRVTSGEQTKVVYEHR